MPTLNKAVDVYIAKAPAYAQLVLLHLREVVHEAVPDVVEEIKWSRPFFVYRGIILGNMSAFKAHCSFGLWGRQLAESLQAENIPSSDGMGTFGRIASVNDLPPRKKLVGYLNRAAKLIDEGERTKSIDTRPKVVKRELEVPPALTAALKKNTAAAKSFEAMAPSCRREYIAWIADAKRDQTRDKRIATAMEWIAEGRSRNWKYESR